MDFSIEYGDFLQLCDQRVHDAVFYALMFLDLFGTMGFGSGFGQGFSQGAQAKSCIAGNVER